ncbi:GH32 C-terminal domain-containing protein [Streptomyces sp. NBC_00841]|uniref:glycoside hydrolase family 32 protein n=1 Tax=unclassified Streptomyces TaxID=2593676 RepID=UPI002252233E|nr:MULTISPECIES: glycoside hydrolase family 32 protein [unclassified Streptomyces]MCX4537096.1 GH32 C-terminal domain-containing protein [Streptomyces sp. NBC_01669]WRZ97660.1 GH32 C-terminal domain-containing protein [Streptomyces sp. NBC_00841]
MSLSRRALLSSAGLTLLAPLAGAGRASAAPSAPAGVRSGSLSGDLAAIPDPIGLTGTWTRTTDGGQRVVTGSGRSAVALSEQRIGAVAGYAAHITIDPQSPHAVGSLVVRATEDGAAGYAASLDPNLHRVRLHDLATGRDLVPPAPVTATPGTTFLLEIAVDGADLTVSLDGEQVLAARDTRYEEGAAGLHAYNGTVVFGPPGLRSVTTTATGWTTDGGTWTATPLGWHAQAPADTNCRALASTRVYDASFQADVRIRDPYAVAALLMRTDAKGTDGYGIQVDPNLNRLRLYRIDGDTTLGTHSTAIEVGQVYRIRIEADGPRLSVRWQTDFITPDGYAPVITAEDSAHTAGQLGVQAYNGSVLFEGVATSGPVTDLQGWSTVSGSWTPDLRGLRAEGASALRTAPFPGGDVLYSADVRLAGAAGAGLVFRADASGAGGYEVRLDATGVRLLDRSDATELGRAAPPVRPFAAGGTYRTAIRALSSAVTVTVDGVDVLTTTVSRTGGAAVGLAVTGGTALFQEVRARTPQTYWTDTYRPAYRYTQLASHTSDPNGLVRYAGEYHLFHQDSGQWAHAVSTDLLHWRPLPVALPVSAFGHTWSGSCVVDTDDASGLFGGGSGLLAFYTSYHPDKPGGNQSVRLASSRDRGRSWQWYGTEPVVQNPGGPDGGWDFRDPKVVRDEQREQWVMVVSGGDHVRFFTSTDLLHWTHRSSFGYGDWVTGGVWECPDFFPLPVDGDPDRVRWVLTLSTGAVRTTDGSAAEYFVGDWDGAVFRTTNTAGTPLRAEAGRDYYAAMSFYGLPDGRRVQLGWLSNWDYAFSAPTGEWNGQLGIPRELTLSDEGLVQLPAAEAETLRTRSTSIKGVTVSPDSVNPLAEVRGRSYEIEAEIALPGTGASTEFGFRLRTGGDRRTLVGYDVGAGKLFVDRTASGVSDFTEHFAGRTSTPLPLDTVDGERRLRIRLFMDTSSVEVFGGDGRGTISSLLFPEPDDQGMAFYADGGEARIVSLSVHRLRDVFRITDTGPSSPATPADGEFRSGGLGDLTVVPAGHWTTSGAGRTGTFDRDSTAVSSTEYGDLELTTLVRFGGPDGISGAGSVLLRATPDTADGYAVNLDPNLRTVRLFRRDGGQTTVLAEVPLLLRTGVTLPLLIRARGGRIEAFIDGRPVIDVTDTRYARGRIGLNVFGGRTAYQDTFVTAL